MSYYAIEYMRKLNIMRFGKDLGPFQPEKHFRNKQFDLKGSALRFLHDRCEDLKYDLNKDNLEKNGNYLGRSIKANQIPYNMQMDLNRLCLERELERFIDSGVAEDAYNVYYCFIEIFFGRYSRSKKMVELLSDYEINGSSLLMKHRDHYSHSVYVFSLGLALYETNSLYRASFKKYYGFDTDDSNISADHAAANFYLEFWGITALFHDIGYPFELPFEQVLSYFGIDKKRDNVSVYMAYKDVDALTEIPHEARTLLSSLYTHQVFNTTNELFAFDIFEKLGKEYAFTKEKLLEDLNNKPTCPEAYSYHMDHAWFSATRLFQELTKPAVIRTTDDDGNVTEHEDYSSVCINKAHIDAMTAILLHNSLFKITIADYKAIDKSTGKKLHPALKMEWHPLAYMIMLCDELQCWDRISYGRSSRSELHPMAAEFDFSNNGIAATYLYDADEFDKIDRYKDEYKLYLEKQIEYHRSGKGKMPERPTLKAYSEMYETDQSFRTNIEKVVELNVPDGVQLSVAVKTAPVDRSSKHIYLSDSNFLHLYDFAIALNARYNHEGSEDRISADKLEEEFEQLSLEYMLSNINQAKAFSKYLNAIDCFYTDRPVDFDMIDSFCAEQTAIFAPMEHERWVIEHQNMGWKYNDFYESNLAKSILGGKYDAKALREQLRMHKLAMDGELRQDLIQKHYNELSEDDKGKDWKPFNSMLKLLRKYDGVRIYKLHP